MIVVGVAPADLVAIVESGLFDERWYAQHYDDVVAAGRDPWEHFVTQGWREGRSPGPAFDLDWYRRRYAVDLPDGVNPVVFYLADGWRRAHWPSPGFDPEQYVLLHPESVGLDFPPIIHAIAAGLL